MSSDTTTTALSEAQQRVFTVKTDTGDIVRYSGNPAELSGARYETRKAMQRAGAFALLVQHNACRVKGGTICVEHLDTIPIMNGDSRNFYRRRWRWTVSVVGLWQRRRRVSQR